METWEDFEQASEQGGIAKVAEEFKSVSKQIEDLEERRDKLKAMLEGEFSQDMGEQSKQAGSYLITLNRQERWSWDKDILVEIYKVLMLCLTLSRKLFQSTDESGRRCQTTTRRSCCQHSPANQVL